MRDSKEPRGLDTGHTIIHTNSMKIAISIPENIFREVKKIAEEQKRSRSDIFVEAVREYLRKLESQHILNSLNEVYAVPETEEERDARTAALALFKRNVLEREKW